MGITISDGLLRDFAAAVRAWHANPRNYGPCYFARRKVYQALAEQHGGDAVLDDFAAIKAELNRAEEEACNVTNVADI